MKETEYNKEKSLEELEEEIADNNFDRELEEEAKKQTEQDIYGYVHQKEKEAEYAAEAYRKSEQFVNSFKDGFELAAGDGEPEPEFDLNEYYAQNSIGITTSGEVSQEGRSIARESWKAYTNDDMIIADGVALIDTFDKAKMDMRRYMKAFQRAQKNKDANFKNGAGVEGSEEYLDVLRSMYDCIDAIENMDHNGLTMQQIGEKYSNVIRLAENYKNTFAASPENIKINRVMDELIDSGKIITSTMAEVGHHMGKCMEKSDKGGMNIGGIRAQDLKGTLMQIYAPDGEWMGKNYEVTGRRLGELKRDSNERAYYTKEAMRNIGEIASTSKNIQLDNYINGRSGIVTGSGLSVGEYAEAFYTKKYIDQLRSGKLGTKGLRNLYRHTKPENFARDVEELSQNPNFRTVVNVRPNSVIKTWQRIDAKSESFRRRYAREFNSMKNKTVGELKGKEVSGYKNITPELVSRMAFGALMSNPDNRFIPESVALMDELGYKSAVQRTNQALVKSMNNYLKRSGILSRMEGQSLDNLPRLMRIFDNPKVRRDMSRIANSATEKELSDTMSRHYRQQMRRDNERSARRQARRNSTRRGPDRRDSERTGPARR